MAIPLDHMKERLHFAYVRAVVARAGATCRPYYDDDYGIDARITAIKLRANGKPGPTSVGFECQLKATTTWEIKDDQIVYDLDADAYNKLVELEDMFGILILLRLPDDPDSWLNVSEDIMCMRHCCYWKLLTGETTTNTGTKRIFIPRQQLFNPQAVTDLLEQVRQRQAEFRRWSMSQ